jgi:hypothetical protein
MYINDSYDCKFKEKVIHLILLYTLLLILLLIYMLNTFVQLLNNINPNIIINDKI